MSTVRPPFFFRWLSPKFILCDFPGEEKVIYLTFDDGPIPEATPEVLEILKKYGLTPAQVVEKFKIYCSYAEVAK